MDNRYKNIQITKTSQKSPRIYVNAVYPDIPVTDNDYYVITVMGDRMDLMAQNFYGDVDYWWILASANSLPGDSLFPPIGIQFRVPGNLKQILDNYSQVNRVR